MINSCIWTCQCQEPPRASHLDFGLMKNNLYWAPPTCGETERQDQGRREYILKSKERVGDGKWAEKQEEGSKTDRKITDL